MKDINIYLNSIFEKSNVKELKHSAASKSLVKKVMTEVKNYDIRVFYLNVDKTQIEKNKDLYVSSLHKLCLYCVNYFCDRGMIFHIDYRGGKRHSKNIGLDLQKVLNKTSANNCKIKYMDSKNSIAIQLADMFSGVIRNKFENKKEEDVFAIIKK